MHPGPMNRRVKMSEVNRWYQCEFSKRTGGTGVAVRIALKTLYKWIKNFRL